MISVKPLQPSDVARWDQFVDAHAQGTLFHKLAWKRIIEKTFNYRPCYLFAEEHGQICGVLPLFHVRTFFAGNALNSCPFAVYGGLLALDRNVEYALLEGAKIFAKQFGADYIELHHRWRSDILGLHTRDSLYCTFMKPIHPNAEACLNALPREARRMVRKGQKLGLTGRFVGQEDVKEFYKIYAASVRHLGTPVFPKQLFLNCLEELRDHADLLLIDYEGKPIAGVLSFYYRQTALPYFGGSLPEKNDLAPNNFMYWTLMHHAGGRGYTCFDFGRSKRATGVFDFKRHMGFEPIPLSYQFYQMNGTPLPNNNPSNPKFRLVINIWRHMPLPLTKALGPRLIREFP